MFGKEIVVNTRKIIKATQLRPAGDLEQVVITGLVLCQQQQMRRVFIQLDITVGHTARSHVGFQADERFYPGIHRSIENSIVPNMVP